MSVFIKLNENFTDATIPVLKRDPALGNGTLFLYDILDPFTWPTQGAAAAGDALIDLGEQNDASISGGALAWDNGLVFDIGVFRQIQLPTLTDLASNVAGFGITLWLKAIDVTGVTDSMLTMGDSGSGYDNTQYMMLVSQGGLRMHACGAASSIHTLAGTAMDTIAADDIAQLGLTMELSGSDYICKQWRDGMLHAQATIAGPMVDAGAETFARIGTGDIFGAPAGFKFLRCHADDLSVRSAQEFIEADWAARQAQFT